MSGRAVTVAVTTASPAVCIATSSSARDNTQSIASIIQSFVFKCNNSNSCKLFYLDYKSVNSEMISNAIHSVSFRLQENSLFCIQQIYFLMSDGPCWKIKYYIADLESFPFMSSIRLCTSLQVHVRLSPNWPNTNETAENANKKCGNIRRGSYSTDEELTPACLEA